MTDTDISWYTKYLNDVGEMEVDLDELVRENERIRKRLSLLIGVKVRRIRWKKYSRRQTTESSSSPKKKRRPLVRNFASSKMNQFLRVPSKSIERAPQPTETLNGYEAQLSGEHHEAQHSTIVKHVLRPVSLRHVKIDEEDSNASGTVPQHVLRPMSLRHMKIDELDSNASGTSPQYFEEKLIVRKSSREHVRGDDNKEWHRQYSPETEEEEEEALKSPPVVSHLVSKFESVRRSNAFSIGKMKTHDPYSSLERKASRDKAEENERRSIRVILHNNPHLDGTDSRMSDSSDHSHATPHEVHKIPHRTSDASKTDIVLLRMKSEGHSRVYPANLSGLSTTDQFTRTPTGSTSLRKGYSFDSGSRSQKHQQLPAIHRQVTFTSDQLAPSIATTHNNTPVVSRMSFSHVDAANRQRAHVASKGEELYRSNSFRTSVDKSPDATRGQMNCSIIKEVDPVPSWKSEVEMRKKTKSYVSAHKPEQPMQLGSIPEWKRLLLEKNKQKRNSTENRHVPINTQITKPDAAGINFTEPAWRLEFDKIRRHVTHQSNHNDAHVFEREVPEWVKIAEQLRKSKAMNENEDVAYN